MSALGDLATSGPGANSASPYGFGQQDNSRRLKGIAFVVAVHVVVGYVLISGLARQAGDQYIAHHHMHRNDKGNALEPAAIVLLPKTVRRGAVSTRPRSRQITQRTHWTNCSAPITAILVSPWRLLPESTVANTA